MGMIIFLPPNFEYENHEEISESQLNNPAYTPNTVINRVHKSHHLIVYEIEHFNINDTFYVTTVSSQKNSSDIKTLYKELRYEPISDILSTTQSHVNIFGVIVSMSFKEDDPKCTTLQLFDFDPKSLVTVKLWRGLAAWIASLSIGARLQIRNLLFKDSTLHSCSTTEIYLLAHGNSESSVALSARANNLNEKEREILLFLSHQSLLIPSKHRSPETRSSVKLTAPLYLEHKNNKWSIQGTLNNDQSATVNFVNNFDAKIWQLLSEIFMDNANKFDLLFERLHYTNSCYEYLNTSTLSHSISTNTILDFRYKRLDWTDLISSKVILFGVFELEAILDHVAFGSSEESLGNLSILPTEKTISSHAQVILRNPNNHDQFVYTENRTAVIKSVFKVQVKTILNDGNVNEIIRKLIFIL